MSRSLLPHHCTYRPFYVIQTLDTNTVSSPSFLRPASSNTQFSLSINISSSPIRSPIFATSTTPSTSKQGALNFDLLEQHLSSQNFRQADEETRRLLIALSGEAAVKRGYVFFSEVQFIAADDLRTIDELWRKHSDNKFGYSVQRRVWKQKANEDFTRFFQKVGWMKKLDTEVEQFNYRSFPNEFMWELNGDTPEGHLPLTNALRGTQLLYSVFTHPAFVVDDEEEARDASVPDDSSGVKDSSNTLNKKVFKTSYSF